MQQKTAERGAGQARHQGIDLLRVVCMYMVLVLHILKACGILWKSGNMDGHFWTAWVVEICAYCAVNCYALISGYVGIYSKYRYTNLAILWLQVVLYVFVANVVGYFLFPGSVSLKTVLKSFFPFLRNEYWYFSAYFCMFFFMPLFNRVVNSLNKKQAVAVCVFIFLFFSVLPTWYRSSDIFELGDGYSVLWLSLLYVTGACIRRFDLMKRVSTPLLLLGYGVCVAAAYVSKLFISYTDIAIITDNISSNILVSYVAPPIFLCGVLLLVLCSKYPKIPRITQKAVSVLASVSFGVYLIHLAPNVYARFFETVFPSFTFLPVPGMIGGVLLSAAAIYGVCALIDLLRIQLFRVLRLRERLNALEARLIGDFWNK